MIETADKLEGQSFLSEEQLKQLLLPHEVVRDPLYGDIRITALERTIIDTKAFQRLRSIKQLGTVELVYPGAMHNRFIHSLGTLHIAEKLVRKANYNYDLYPPKANLVHIGEYPRFLTRMCALLHDAAHVPYGHMLEDEGKLSLPEWKDPKRAELWLGEKSEIVDVTLRFLRESGVEPDVAKKVVDDICKYVRFNGDPMELEYPFVIDLVGNTLCADLLDYLERDMFFSGLRERSGDRVINYIAVVNVSLLSNQKSSKKVEIIKFMPSKDHNKGKGRVVLLAYRYEREHLAGGDYKLVPQQGVLTEAIDLLRRRFALAEKVTFHRTKIQASAMLISAMGSASFDFEDIYELSDEKFLEKLASDDNSPRTKYLAHAFKERRLYKRIYRLNYHEESDDNAASKEFWNKRYPEFRDPTWRKQKENEIERLSFLPKGSIVIYCPDRKMNIKEFKMLVQNQPEDEIKPLKDILHRNRKKEMESINEPFANLWYFAIYVDPKVLDPSLVSNEDVKNLNAICEAIIGLPNEIPDLRGTGRPLREQIADRAIQEWEEKNNHETVPHRDFLQLVNIDHRGEKKDLFTGMKSHLKEIMAGK